MDQRRGEINVKDRDQEHTVYQNTSNYKKLCIHGDVVSEDVNKGSNTKKQSK